MPSFPPLVVSGQIIAAAHINALRNALIASYGEVYAWTANVAAGNRNLTGVATLGATTVNATTISASGSIAAASLVAPTITSAAGGAKTFQSSGVDGEDGMLIMHNTFNGAKKHWRINRMNELQLVNGAYSTPLLSINDTGEFTLLNQAWNAGTLRLGPYRLWVDGAGRLRIKNTMPTSDTDGAVVGTQS